MNVTFYHRLTGIAHSHWSGPECLVERNAPPDHLAREGHFDMYAQRVDVDHSAWVPLDWQAPSTTDPQPLIAYVRRRPGGHVWNTEAGHWELTDEALRARAQPSHAERLEQRIAAIEGHLRAVPTLSLDTAGSK